MAKIIVKCANEKCTKEFESRTDKIAKGLGIYCSRACSAEVQRKPMSVERRKKLKEVHNRPETKEKHRKATIRQLQGISPQPRNTPLEQKLCEELTIRKISYLTQQPMLGKYVVDILLRDYPIVIEADGVLHRLPRRKAIDAVRDAEMLELGYIVLRFPGQAIFRNLTACGDKIAEVIQQGIDSGVFKPIDINNFTAIIGDQRGENNPMFGRDPWNKGLSAETDERLAEAKANWKKSMLEKGYWDKWRGKSRVEAPWENLKEDYHRLGSLVRVAELYGVGKTTVYRQLKAQGIEIMPLKGRETWANRGRELTPEHRKHISEGKRRKSD